MFKAKLDGVSLSGLNKFETEDNALEAAIDELAYRTPELVVSAELVSIFIKGKSFKVVSYCDEFDDPEGYGYGPVEHEIDIFEI